MDLSLSDALTDSVPQSSPESLVQKDFVAQLEAEAFDDQVGETVGKTDYIPLLDNDDTRTGENDMMEPGGASVMWILDIVTNGAVIRKRGHWTMLSMLPSLFGENGAADRELISQRLAGKQQQVDRKSHSAQQARFQPCR
ncbi:hypothetical protein PAMP_011467 [Pampus punctatissimus]